MDTETTTTKAVMFLLLTITLPMHLAVLLLFKLLLPAAFS